MKNTHKKFEAWATPHLAKMSRVLLLDHFHPVSISYDQAAVGKFFLCCDHQYPYQTIHLSYGDAALRAFEKKDYATLLNSLTHEMVHPLTDALYSVAFNRFVTNTQVENEREKLTDHIANIVLKGKLI